MPSTNKNKQIKVLALETCRRSAAALGAIGFVALAGHTVPSIARVDKSYDKVLDAGCNTDSPLADSSQCHELKSQHRDAVSQEQERGSAAVLFGLTDGMIVYGAGRVLRRLRDSQSAPVASGAPDLTCTGEDDCFKFWERSFEPNGFADQ